MTAPLLRLVGLGKVYRGYASEWLRILSWFYSGIRPREEHRILRDVSFSVYPGEAVGIVGQNGAGKSTLLKMITGTTFPSEGRIETTGRINAILELGMGFNGELTGRENVIHAASLMGHDLATIQSAMPQIEAFAEIGDYFDQPVRTYSSGMQVRVAFAVATFDQPDLLIVDEALAVGDSYFQHKSFRRIRALQEAGTALLIVSHDRGSIQALCSRAILLDKGEVVLDGEPEAVMDFYNALIAEREGSTIETTIRDDGRVETRSGEGQASVTRIALENALGVMTETVRVGENVTLKLRVEIREALEYLVLGYAIKDRLGQVIYGTNTQHKSMTLSDLKPGEVYEFTLKFAARLGVGSYSLQTALCNSENHVTGNYEWRDMALVFDVINPDLPLFAGCAWIDPEIQIEKQPE